MRSLGRSSKVKVKMDPRFENMTFYDFMIAEPESNDPSHVIKTASNHYFYLDGLSYTVE